MEGLPAWETLLLFIIGLMILMIVFMSGVDLNPSCRSISPVMTNLFIQIHWTGYGRNTIAHFVHQPAHILIFLFPPSIVGVTKQLLPLLQLLEAMIQQLSKVATDLP